MDIPRIPKETLLQCSFIIKSSSLINALSHFILKFKLPDFHRERFLTNT